MRRITNDGDDPRRRPPLRDEQVGVVAVATTSCADPSLPFRVDPLPRALQERDDDDKDGKNVLTGIDAGQNASAKKMPVGWKPDGIRRRCCPSRGKRRIVLVVVTRSRKRIGRANACSAAAEAVLRRQPPLLACRRRRVASLILLPIINLFC
jgi:hypothetical protein